MDKNVENRMNGARLLAAKILKRFLGEKECPLEEPFKSDIALQRLFQSIQSEITPEKLEATDEQEWEMFQQKYRLTVTRPRIGLKRYWVAASVVVMFGIGLFFWREKQRDLLPLPAQWTGEVTLTTGTGEAYSLEKMEQSRWIRTQPIEIKENGREMIYAKQSQISFPVEWHTIQVPARKGYTVVLADSTKVILNARSSLKYPTCFADSVREVWLEGEAYFEVKRDDRHPFVVHFQENRLTVLGTTFNLSCPAGEMARTTLLSGAVALDNTRQSVVLRPGEEGIIVPAQAEIFVQEVDVEEAVAWTRNMFYFKSRTLGEIVEKLSDWYGLNVLFQEEALRELVLTVESIRYEDIEEVLKIIKTIGRIDYVQYEDAILLSRQK